MNRVKTGAAPSTPAAKYVPAGRFLAGGRLRLPATIRRSPPIGSPSEAGRSAPYGPDLPLQPVHVDHRPDLVDPVVFETEDHVAGDLDRAAGRRGAEEVAIVRAGQRPAHGGPVALADHILDLVVQVREPAPH